MRVTIIQTGTANLASIVVAFERAGAAVCVTRAVDEVDEAAALVLPGVGTFAAGNRALAAAGLMVAVLRRIELGRPFLGICLGLQLLGISSSESPGVEGLGVIPEAVESLDDSAPVPQMGWNHVTSNGGLVEPGDAYFANSFAFKRAPTDWAPAHATHGGERFVAAVQRGPALACQFHPELSGAWGAELIQRWLEEASC